MTRKEALEYVNNMWMSKETHDALETLIPEFGESEDERIRKELIDAIKIGRSNSGISFSEEVARRYIAWLEKQKKHQENCTKFLAKILKHSAEGFRNVLKKKGIDYIPQESFWTGTAGTYSKQECNEFYKWMNDMTMELVTEETPEYKKGFKDGLNASKKEQEPTLKFKVGDKIHLIDGTSPNYEDDCITIGEIGTINYIGEFKEGYVPIKEQDKWELVKEPKPAEWNEEDKRKLNRIYEILGNAADDKGFLTSKRIIGDKEAVELQEYIKSLHPSWKPSEEQMADLLHIEGELRGLGRKDEAKAIAGLYEQFRN